MDRTQTFIHPDVFLSLLDKIGNQDGEPYKNPDKVYRDMSRLVATWLANAKSADLRKIHEAGGWTGLNTRPLQKCAKAWLKQHHEDFPRGESI